MPENVAEPALNGLRLNLRIVSVVIFNFASYLTIGLPLAVLPGYVHDVMGFSAFWAGLVISEKRRKPSPNTGGDIRRKARRALKINQALTDSERRL